MLEKYRQQLAELATSLVTPERFGKVALSGTVESEYPDLPEAAIYYFPDRSEDSVA